MKSYLTEWFLNLKLDVTLEESVRKRSRILDVRHHGLEECPSLLARLPPEYLSRLRCLLLQSNYLPNFPRVNCHCLESLRALTLDYNHILDLPFDLRHLKTLTVLNVSHNPFINSHFLPVICQLRNLRILWANCTGITEIPAEIGDLTHLRTLGLRRNKIWHIPKELFSLDSLRWLTLAGNRISEISHDFPQLSNLVHLNLQRNSIYELPFNFNCMPELQYLFLDYNRLLVNSELQSFIYLLPNLKYCSISGNNPTFFSSFGTTSEGQPESGNEEDDDGRPNSRSSSVTTASLILRSQREQDAIANEVHNENQLIDPRENVHTTAAVPNQLSPPETASESERTAEEEEDDDRGNVRSSSGKSSISSVAYIDIHSEIESMNEEGSGNGTTSCFSKPPQYNTDTTDTNSNPVELLYASNIPENDNEEGLSEAVLESELPLMRPVGELKEAVHSGGSSSASAENNNKEPTSSCLQDGNGNPEKQLSRLELTRQWLQNNGEEQPKENNIPLEKDVILCKKREVHRHVDTLLEQAAQQASSTQMRGPIRSSSLVYMMPHNRDPKPYSLNVSSSFQSSCPPTVSSTLLVTAACSHPTETRLEENVYANANDEQHNSPRNRVMASSNYSAASTAFLESPSTTTSTFLLDEMMLEQEDGEAEAESNYDPSDWEHSAPSSAIDDQDIITRFADLQEEIDAVEREEEQGDTLNLAHFEEPFWRNLVRLLMIFAG